MEWRGGVVGVVRIAKCLLAAWWRLGMGELFGSGGSVEVEGRRSTWEDGRWDEA